MSFDNKDNKINRKFKMIDVLLIVGMIVPILSVIVLKILTNVPANGVEVSGARIFFEFNAPLQKLYITESEINSWAVIISIFFLCLYLTHGICVKAELKRQLLLEWALEQVEKMTNSNMGEFFSGFAPFIASVMALSAFSSLLSLVGLFPPTSDLNIVAGWAILVFILITYYRFRCGPVQYLKSFGDPVPLLSPLNVISEVATPISMAFRHYGNILSGVVISILLSAALGGLTEMVLGGLPGLLGDFPFFRIGIPAVLSIYFDVFSGCLQAYIFAMLTMMYVSSAFNIDEFEIRKRKKAAKLKAKSSV